MGNNSFNQTGNGVRTELNYSSFPPFTYRSFMYYLSTLYKIEVNKMLTAKLSWILANILGWPITIMAIVMMQVPSMEVNVPVPIQNALSFFALIFLIAQCWKLGINCLIAYEKYRADKHENDKNEFDLKVKKNNHK